MLGARARTGSRVADVRSVLPARGVLVASEAQSGGSSADRVGSTDWTTSKRGTLDKMIRSVSCLAAAHLRPSVERAASSSGDETRQADTKDSAYEETASQI